MSKTIVISSGKGGVGKTITAVNLASALNYLGKKTILLDSNLSTPNIAISLGAPVIPVTLNHVLMGKKHIYEAVYEHHSGVKVVPASLSVKDLQGIQLKKFNSVVNSLKKDSDFIIIDSAAGIGHEALLPFQVADEILIVTNPEITALTDALKTIKIAERFNKKVSVILTRIRNENELSTKEVKMILDKQILARIPEDESIREALMSRSSVIESFPKSKASKAYIRLAKKISGSILKDNSKKIENQINNENTEKKKSRFFRWMFNES